MGSVYAAMATVDSETVESLDDRLGDESRVATPTAELLSLCGEAESSEAAARDLAEQLASAGIGFEPDPRFGPTWPQPGTDVVVFRLADDAPSSPSPAYVSAQVAVGLAMVVAAADSEVTDSEREAIQDRLSTSLQLVPAEKERLAAHEHWLLLDQPRPNLRVAHDRISGLERPRRLEIGRFLAFVAAADGRVHPREREWLERCFRALDLTEEDLDADLDAIEDVEREWDFADEGSALDDPDEVLDLLLSED